MANSGYDALMHEVCVGWGFCGSIKDGQPTHVDFLIPKAGPVSADQFVEWVFIAEDLDPHADAALMRRCRKGLRAAFIKHMGAETVDASLLEWTSVREAGGGEG